MSELDRLDALTRREPANADAHNDLGIALVQIGQPARAAASFQRAIEIQPRFAEALNNLGYTLGALRRPEEAVGVLERAIAVKPKYADAHNNLGIALAALGRLGDAVKSYQRAIRHRPDYVQAHNNLGNALWRLGRRIEAAASYAQALKFNPEFADAHNGVGNALTEQGRWDEAIAHYKRALTINPSLIDGYNNLGVALRGKGAHEEALAQFSNALKLRPDFVDAWNNLGITLGQMGEHDKAIEIYRRALHFDANYPKAHDNLGAAFSALGRMDEAIGAHRQALALDPDFTGAHYNLGLALLKIGRTEEAAASFACAMDLQPDFTDAHLSHGVAMAELRRHGDAIESFSRALAIEPSNALARAQRLHQQAIVCDWKAMSADASLIPELGVVGAIAPPFATLSLEDEPARHRIRAERFASERYASPPQQQLSPRQARPQHLRIGYVSADVRDHAVMFLIARVFELHDRERFSVTMYSCGPDRGDATGARVRQGVDVFRDVRTLPDAKLAELVAADGIDVAIDLTGHTQRSRSALFARRVAPVQINFLGYPGTLGIPQVDYIVADHILIPESARAYYTEAPIYLPYAYQPNDDTRPIADLTITRADAGLPENGFVFCCFNNSYKITATEFDLWMRLLSSVDGSVLWLLQANQSAVENVRRAAAARGVAPDRLVFAPPRPPAEHLARHRLADLFLDTFIYNAHTTASDALWTGLPLVTKVGKGFAARVAASLLTAAGLPELITDTEQAYFDLALGLAQDPARLAALRHKLETQRLSSALFDSAKFTHYLEAALDAAYQRHLDGLPPNAIKIAP